MDFHVIPFLVCCVGECWAEVWANCNTWCREANTICHGCRYSVLLHPGSGNPFCWYGKVFWIRNRLSFRHWSKTVSGSWSNLRHVSNLSAPPRNDCSKTLSIVELKEIQYVCNHERIGPVWNSKLQKLYRFLCLDQQAMDADLDPAISVPHPETDLDP